MFEMLPFRNPNEGKKVGRAPKEEIREFGLSGNMSDGVFDVSNLPKEMDVYWDTLEDFIPVGMTWDDLTDSEKEMIKTRYRFAFLRPGTYQAITGIGGANGQMYP